MKVVARRDHLLVSEDGLVVDGATFEAYGHIADRKTASLVPLAWSSELNILRFIWMRTSFPVPSMEAVN